MDIGLTEVIDFQSTPAIALTSLAFSKILEFVKQHPKLPLSSTSDRANRTLVVLYSFFIAMGLQFQWSGYTADVGGSFTITLPPLASVVNGLWAWWTSEVNYKFLVKERKPQG